MDTTQALRDAENALRDFIALLLSKDNPDWVSHCGIAPDRIERWKERKATEAKRQETGVVEERLIYYADFYDLKTILKRNWAGEFSAALGDWKTFEVYIGELEKLRDADAHRRELLPHQKHLVLGVSGEIRNRIVRYRSKMETPDDCFPRIESVRDSLGNLWVPGCDKGDLKAVGTNASLRPGDILEFVVTATDPEDMPLQYAVAITADSRPEWQSNANLRFVIGESHIGRTFCLEVSIRSPRPYHARRSNDDSIIFIYNVLPCSKTTVA
ncbi:MAG: hypothetical protein PHP70_03650 [Gallionella sp.]|nr:hypothetical protein [Gallionella sp.]